jgi:hypothetical protein
MQVTQNREVQTFQTLGPFTAQVPIGPVHTKITFSDGTEISKYGKTTYWVCLVFQENGFAKEEAIQEEDLLNYLPELAAEELIYNMDIFIQL